MLKIFIGLFFVFINFNLGMLNVMPPFVGYLLILAGMREEATCPSQPTSQAILLVSAVLDAALWAMNLLGMVVALPVGTVLQILCTYRLVLWVEEQGKLRGWDPKRVSGFHTAWYVVVIGLCLALIGAFLSQTLTLVGLVIFIVAVIYFLYTYYKLWKGQNDGTLGGGRLV